MKEPADAVAAIERRLANSWHLSVGGDPSWWPYRFPLGRPTREKVTHQFGQVQRWAFDWQEWADSHNLTLEWEGRLSGSSHDRLPTHLLVPDIDTAANLRPGWRQQLARGRARYVQLAGQFPDAPLPQVVRAVDEWTDTDVELLVAAAHWFTAHPNSGLSPRQVPVEGLHSKWLAGHGTQVLALTGLPTLGLVEPRRTPLHLTYLDPAHLAAGGRHHDSVMPGDTMRPAYPPRLVLVTENKDTAILFPHVPGAVTVQGQGKAGPAFVSQVGWLCSAQQVVYWGDLDADGFTIVNSYRAAGVPVRTILMDLPTLDEYRRFAATTDPKGRNLSRAVRAELPLLTGEERAAYEAITDPAGGWPVRVEQERIPLGAALDALTKVARSGC